jgi:NAD+-dependent protein deacetylase sirtuin 4
VLGAVRPDGDAELPADMVVTFQVVGCRSCGGTLKPDVVFFGGTVAEPTLSAAWELLGAGAALLVIGSSLTVYAGFRFVRRAHELAMPIAIVNVGTTRGDGLAHVRVSAPAGAVLPRLAAALQA